MKKYTFLITLLCLTATYADAQFPIKIPKINVPKAEKPKTETPKTESHKPVNQASEKTITTGFGDGLGRQMVIDDGVTFFDAEPVSGRDAKTNREIDTGWFLKSHLRIFGTFPKRSAFRIVVKKNGKELSSTRCEGDVFIKKEKYTNHRLEHYNLDFEDYMSTDSRCYDKEQVNKEIGNLNVEVYFIDGDTDKETLVRTHKIDVHKAARVIVSNSIPYPDVSHYYIQRHAESAVAIAFFSTGSAINAAYYEHNSYNFVGKYVKSETSSNINTIKLGIYTSFSPDGTKGMPGKPFAKCSVNGQKVTFKDDSVKVAKNLNRREMATFSKRGFSEQIEFTGLIFILPVYFGNDKAYYGTDPTPDGKWECAIVENGVTFRTFRFEIKNGDLARHPEQQNGNINLFYKSSLVDMEIPTGGSRFDFRLSPSLNAGLFYGIPWTTAEGKATAARLPKKGNPYHVEVK